MQELAARFFSIFQFNNLFSLQFFQLARYASFLLLGVAFAQLQLNPSQIGQFETVLLLTGMVSFFWVSGVINTMMAQYPRADEAGKKSLLFNTFITICFLNVLAGLALLAFSFNLLHLIGKGSNENLIRLSLIYLLLNSPGFINEYILFLNNRKKALLYYALALAVITVAAGVTPVLLGYPITWAVYGLIGVAALKLVFSMVLLGKYTSATFDTSIIFNILRISAPLMLSLFVGGSAEYIDGMIIKARFDDRFFAIYRYGAKELPILLIIANTFSTAMIPALAGNLNEGLAELKQRSARLMHVFFPITIILMLASPFIYPLVFNPNFAYSAFIFNIYLLLAIPRLTFPQTLLTATKHTGWILLSAIIEIIINIALSLYLSQKLGLYGVAAGTLIAYLIDKVFLATVTAIVLKIPPGRYIALAPLALYSILTIVAFTVGYAFLVHF